MNRRVFAFRIAEQTDHCASATAIDAILEAAIAVLAGELVKVGRFEWRGFGTFTVRTYPTRKIHNPATGKTIALPARKSVTYKPSRKIRVTLKAARRSRMIERPAKAGADDSKTVLKSGPVHQSRSQRSGRPGVGDTSPVSPRGLVWAHRRHRREGAHRQEDGFIDRRGDGRRPRMERRVTQTAI